MAYPIIILGAGASHDFIDISRLSEKKEIPPLTENLFQPSRFASLLRKKYPKASKLSAEAIPFLIQNKGTLEDYLSYAKKRSVDVPDRKKQLIDFQFYLQDIFREISKDLRYEPNSNYNHMLNKIDDTKTKNVCFVNFNYDLLLEYSLGFINRSSHSYIENPIKVIKIHGACNWCWRFKGLYDLDFPTDADFPKYIIDTMQDFSNPEKESFFCYDIDDESFNYVEEQSETERERKRYFLLRPRIAIPIAGKSWVCPNEHIETLKDFLRKTDRILIIGWGAGDPEFLMLMEQEFKNRESKPMITIVSKDKKEAERAEKEIKQIVKNAFFKISEQQGFTKFMDSGECDKFFRDPNF